MDKKFLKYLAVCVGLSLLVQATVGFAQSNATPGATTDTTVPSDVENAKAVPGDGSVTLTWDVATDNVAVTGYKIYYGTQSVKKPTDSYEFAPVSVEDVVTGSVENLENGKTYYFGVTAVDAAGNESESYSPEVEAIPQAGLRGASVEDDRKNPEVKEAEAKAEDQVKIVFSEPVVLPLENPEKAFLISKKSDKKIALEVKRAELDPEDEEGKSVILETAKQTSEEEYEITVGVEIQDHFGNTVVASKETDEQKTDKFVFKGFKQEEEQPKDETAPEVKSVEADEITKVSVTFSEAVDLGGNPKSHFGITKKSTDSALAVKNVSVSKDGKVVYITTDQQEKTAYELMISDVQDEAGNRIEKSVSSFEGKGPSLRDLVSPEDVTELIAKVKEAQANIVELTWKKSKNSAGDLVDQMLYQSLNRGKKYDTGTSLSSDVEIAEVKSLKRGRLYTFKITSKDSVGNESQGTVVSFRLPETGPALPLAFLISGLVGYFARRKKR